MIQRIKQARFKTQNKRKTIIANFYDLFTMSLNKLRMIPFLNVSFLVVSRQDCLKIHPVHKYLQGV